MISTHIMFERVKRLSPISRRVGNVIGYSRMQQIKNAEERIRKDSAKKKQKEQ